MIVCSPAAVLFRNNNPFPTIGSAGGPGNFMEYHKAFPNCLTNNKIDITNTVIK